MNSRALLIYGAVLLSLLPTPATSQMQVSTQPNFLVIVVDDLGWSDLSFLGSEIRTPNIDNLANEGMLLSNFYVAPTCSPTRAMLMTGVNNHAAGMGTMHGLASPNQQGHIQYDGQLHDGVVTVAELLRDKGYATLMAGKWHLGLDAKQHPNNR